MNLTKLIFLTFIFNFLLTNNVYAYLDPGTGSIIIQAIVGAIAAILTFVSWVKIETKKKFYLFKNSQIYQYFDKKKFFIAGSLIFFLPLIIFFKPFNLKQLSSLEVQYLFLFHSILFLLVIILSFVISRLFKAISFANFEVIFFLISIFFYFQFFYKSSLVIFFDHGKIYFILYEILILSLTILIFKFRTSFVNLSIIYSLILIIYFSSTIINYKNSLNDEVLSKNFNKPSIELNENVLTIDQLKEQQNIYFIIFDGMLSLEEASEIDIIDKDQEIKKINNLGLRYIKNSFSNYDNSHLTLGSIFNLDYIVNANSDPYTNLDFFFPNMLNLENLSNLEKILIKSDIKFYWGGNLVTPCIVNKIHTNCLIGGFYEQLAMVLLKFYVNTPLYKIYYKFVKSPDRYYPSDDLIFNFDQINLGKKNFFFIHNISPRTPYIFNKDCSKNSEFNKLVKNTSIKNGYKNNYICALNKIKVILNFLKKNDPDSLIVIQGDHGWNNNLDLNEDKKIPFRAKIFNAIKAPNECFINFGLPKTNINVIRFALNCALGYNLKKVDDIHFISFDPKNQNYGRVIEKTSLVK